jgi:Asp-tRNA(Asn)/Glu-tRNA(Gln) amidotransferase A subunit family amidase
MRPDPANGFGHISVEELSIDDLHAAYRAGVWTVQQVVAAHLARIAAYDKRGPLINSMITVNHAAMALAADQDVWLAAHPGEIAGPLFGVPVVVKDNIDMAGLPMTSGFQGWKNYVPPADAPVIARIKAAGGVIVGKTSLSEFARGGHDNINSVVPGFARNPYHTAYATGGSSGGVAAALAASFAVVGIGTDTGGSVRMPAAHCALAGLRPTVGLVSRTGVVPLDLNRDTVGPMARSAHDMAVLLDVIVEDPDAPSYCEALNTAALQGARLGVLRQVFPESVTDAGIIRNFANTIAELRALGAEVIDPFVVPGIDAIPRPPQTPARFAWSLAQYLDAHPGIPYPSVREIAASGLLHPLHQRAFDDAVSAPPQDEDPATLEGAANEQRYRDAFTAAMDAAGIDALVFPTWAMLPAVNGDRNTQVLDQPVVGLPAFPEAAPVTYQSSLTFVASALQWPALSVPSGYLGEDLPVGLQIVACPGSEAKIVTYAYAYEQATRHRHPPASTPPLGDSLAAWLVGTWTLLDIRERDVATGVETSAQRRPRSGQLTYGTSGALSVQIARAGYDGLLAEGADGFESYFGRWRLHEADGYVQHVRTAGLDASLNGTVSRHSFCIDGAGRLWLAASPLNGRSEVFLWERSRSC